MTPTTDVKIRLATSDDLLVLAEMNRQLIKDEGHSNSMSEPELLQRMESWLGGEYIAAILEDASAIVGYVVWRSEQHCIYIRQFFVQPEYRRKGVATRAIQLLKQAYWQRRVLRLEVLVNNRRGRSFWQSVGFKEYSVTMERK